MASERALSAAGSDITVASIDNIIQELLSHAEIEVDNSVRSIEEASCSRRGADSGNGTRNDDDDDDYHESAAGERVGGQGPTQGDDPLPPVEAENSFTPSFAQESSVWYDAQGYDHVSDLEDARDQNEAIAEAMSDAISESEFSEGSFRSSARKSESGLDGPGPRYSSRDAIKSVQNRLLSVMKKEAKLHIRAEMAKSEVDVLKSKLAESENRAKRSERHIKQLEGRVKHLKTQDTYVQCKRLQASLAKSTEVNSKLVHKIQTLKLELRKEKARRHHAEQTAKLSFGTSHVPLDVMDSMESLETFQNDQTLNPSAAAHATDSLTRHFNTKDKGFEISDLRNQVRHLKGALEQAEQANTAILSQIQEESPGPNASRNDYLDSGSSELGKNKVINLHNFLSKPVIAEVKSSLAELKSSLTEERFQRSRERPLREDQGMADYGAHDYEAYGYEGEPPAETTIAGDHQEASARPGVVGGVTLHYASQIPPQNMDKGALKQAREAYQEEVKRMRQLFLSRQGV